jgi:hypothetical protein
VVVLVLTRTTPYPMESRHIGELRPLLLRGGLATSVTRPLRPLLIDLYWLRCLIGMGEPESEARNRNLASYGFFLTDLDPRFFHAYYFFGLATPYSLGQDRYANGDLALELVRRGIKQFPEDVRLRMLHAFLLHYVIHDGRAAVMEFVTMAKLPGAPAAALSSATALMVEEGRLDDAIEAMQNAMDEGGRGSMQLLSDRKKQLEIEKLLRELDRAIERSTVKLGHTPTSLAEVVAAGEWSPLVTHDMHGGELRVESGRGRSSWLVGRLEGIPQW